jgi:protein involved in sex pheromone biosynthesis
MKKNLAILGVFLSLVMILTGCLPKKEEKKEVPAEAEVGGLEEIQKEVEEKTGFKIPENVTRANLSDVTGGTSRGLATKVLEDGQFKHTILADLTEPALGKFYEGWLVKDEDYIPTGRLGVQKGGWVLGFSSATNYMDYDKVVVTEEEKDDKKPEKHILEGSF